MKKFHCICDPQPTLFFDSFACTNCQRLVGFCPDQLMMRPFEASDEVGVWLQADNYQNRYRQCVNYAQHNVCNWMVPAADGEPYCVACRLNEMIPDLSVADNPTYWARLESAKRSALYTILSLGLPLQNSTAATDLRLRFRFLADSVPSTEFTEPLIYQEPVMTGHSRGVITVNLAEADDIARTRAQVQLYEKYRTLLGHFRHEIGHYYWALLVEGNQSRLTDFRQLFGDERQNYEAARQTHYEPGSTATKPEQYISSYAAMHPWEDWAESWAHYLHMMDTLETAASFGLQLFDAPVFDVQLWPQGTRLTAEVLFAQWRKLAVVLNSLNRSMGLQDAYPFVLNRPIEQKLAWIHELVGVVARG